MGEAAIYAVLLATSAVAAPAPMIDWVRKPTLGELASKYPEAAAKAYVAGRAILDCQVELDGSVDHCSVIEESPKGMGFGEAAVSVAPKFRMTAGVPAQNDRRPKVRVPVAFEPPPRFDREPTLAEIAAAYPPSARAANIQGEVLMSCDVETGGALRNCQTTSERPDDQGFAAAALSLAPAYRANPVMHGQIQFWVDFPVVRVPISGPTLEQYRAAYPAKALAEDVAGRAQLDCEVDELGRLNECKIDSEAPAGWGFGAAALSLAPFILFPPVSGATDVGPSIPHMPIIFDPDMGVAKPVSTPTPDQIAAAYPPAARSSGKVGVGVILCDLALDGRLLNCAVDMEEPPGSGFGAAAVILAPDFRYTPGLPDIAGKRPKVHAHVSFGLGG